MKPTFSINPGDKLSAISLHPLTEGSSYSIIVKETDSKGIRGNYGYNRIPNLGVGYFKYVDYDFTPIKKAMPTLEEWLALPENTSGMKTRKSGKEWLDDYKAAKEEWALN